MIGDTQSRQETPCRIVPLGFNGNAGTDQDINSSLFGQAVNYGDLKQLVSNGGAIYDDAFNPIGLNQALAVQQQNAVRIPTLHSGEVTQIYLTFRLHLGGDEVGTRSMWVGYANASHVNPNRPEAMNPDTIKQAHRMITGSDDGFQAAAGGYIQFNKLNITPLLQKAREGYGWKGLVFYFDQKPARTYNSGSAYLANDNGYELQVFRIEAMARFKGTI